MQTDSADITSGNTGGAQFDSRSQLIEVAVFLFLIGPSMFQSFFLIDLKNVSFMLAAVATTLRDLSLLTLVLFFLWRNKESVLRIGWTLQGVWRDILLGAMLFVPMFFGAAILEKILETIGLSAPSTPLQLLKPSTHTSQMVAALVLVTTVALTEETIFRGYLILRFKNIFGGSFLSVLLSAFIFSLGHGYEGAAGVVTVCALGLVFGFVYVWRKSLVAPITMHFLQDFVSIVILPHFVGK
ncbi:MAG: type II CAAX endopeptidase family protein [Desulfomonilaceae bacterium]